MAAPPPRKFNEKIALLHQKEMEDSAAFESVMADVKNITRQVWLGSIYILTMMLVLFC